MAPISDGTGFDRTGSDETVVIPIRATTGNPALLEGLDSLVRLGLVSDRQIKLIAREQLSCKLPTLPAPSIAAQHPAIESSASQPRLQPVAAASAVSEPTTGQATGTAPTPRSGGSTSPSSPRWFQSFMDELSVLWLLFLGVFLVVVSSAVLAASQWQNVSAVGQYLILFTYTVAFWGAGLWAGRQEKLRLTTRMLQRVTLLLVPINFWAMDGFKLWAFPIGWVVCLGTAIALTAILLNLLRPRLHRTPTPKRLAGVTLALSWLHWGWAIAIMPLLASYVGMIGTAIAIVYPDNDDSGDGDSGDANPSDGTPSSDDSNDGDSDSNEPNNRRDRFGLPSTTLIALFGALLLVGRALLVAQVPLTQLGFAFGLCGAVLAWRSRRTAAYGLWFGVGSGLMLLGWLASLQIDPPWQPVAISLLALGIVAERLKRLRLPFDLTLLFLTGLQSIWLLRRFVPVELRDALVERIAAIAGQGGMPFAVVGVTVFPYLLLFLALGERFRRQGESKLARQANFLCLTLGTGLTVFSLGNDLMRPLNLTLSALTLGLVLRRRDLGQGWPYLTQLLTWGALLSWVGFVFDPGRRGWLAVLLVGALVEWGLSLGLIPRMSWRDRPQSWRLSAWHSGLALSVLAYLVACVEAFPDSELAAGLAPWSLLWWVVPIALLVMVIDGAKSDRCPQPDAVQTCGILALFLVQLFTWEYAPYRLASFGLTTLLMGMHSRLLPTRLTTAATVGFGVAFSFCLAFRGQPGLATGEQWMFALAAIALILWSLWGGLRQQSSRLKQRYGNVANGWAIALLIPVSCFLVIETLNFYIISEELIAYWFALISPSGTDIATLAPASPPSGWTLATAVLATLAMALTLRLGRSEVSAYGLALATELLLALGIANVGVNMTQRWTVLVTMLAIANLLLGLAIQILGDARLRRGRANQRASRQGADPQKVEPSKGLQSSDLPSLPNPWDSIPLAYAILGFCLGHWPFDAFSGLFTLATAGIGVGIGRRDRELTPITYFALTGFSLGAYELLVYQLSQSSGGSAGDGIVLLALLGAVLALGNQLLSRWILPHIHLKRDGFRLFTHLHWGLGSLFGTLALILRPFGELSQTGGYLWMLTTLLLGIYALAQTNRQSDWGWGDLGLTQLLSVLGYGIHLVFPWPVLPGWAAAIACPIAVALQRFPWRRWGWSPRAGRRWAKLLPIILVVLTAWDITIQSLLLVAVFYAGLSVGLSRSSRSSQNQDQGNRAIRLSYLSVLLADWAVLRIFDQLRLTDGLWYAAVAGATVLYIAQMDPKLQSDRELRHGMRCLGSGIVCVTALYQGQVGLGNLQGFGAGLVAIALSLGFVLAGIGLRIRAFLYVGTAAFLIQVLLQVWQFIQDESLLLWAIGIVLGMLMIWVAATFEARRSQVIAFISHWVNELEDWQ